MVLPYGVFSVPLTSIPRDLAWVSSSFNNLGAATCSSEL